MRTPKMLRSPSIAKARRSRIPAGIGAGLCKIPYAGFRECLLAELRLMAFSAVRYWGGGVERAAPQELVALATFQLVGHGQDQASSELSTPNSANESPLLIHYGQDVSIKLLHLR